MNFIILQVQLNLESFRQEMESKNVIWRYKLQRKLPKEQCRRRISYKSYHMVYVQTASAETIKATE